MKKIFALLLCLSALAFSVSYAQTSPTINNRSGSSNQQVDEYLIALKRLGIPTSTTDNLDADFAAENTRKLLFNTTLNKLRVYNPATSTWADAAATDIASVTGLQAALNGKVSKTGDEVIAGNKNFTGETGFQGVSANYIQAGGLWTMNGINTDGSINAWGDLEAGYSFVLNGGSVTKQRILHNPAVVGEPDTEVLLPLTSGTLALTSDLTSKANLSGGNNFTGNQNISGGLSINGAASSYREFMFKTNNSLRWDLYAIGDENGSNSGSDLYLSSYTDAGDYNGNVFSINRANRILNFQTRPQIGGNNVVASDGLNYTLNINGYASNLDNAGVSDWDIASNNIIAPGRFRAMNGANVTGMPDNGWWNILSMRHHNPANDYRMEIASPFGDPYKIIFRNTGNDPSRTWNTFFHSGNKDYVKTELGLPSSGGFDLQGSTARGNVTTNNIIAQSFGVRYSDGSTYQTIGADGSGLGTLYKSSITTGDVPVHRFQGYDVVDLLTIKNGGHVGIGTSAPLSRLHVQADANTSGAPANAQLLISGNTHSDKRLSLGYNTSSNYAELQSQAYTGSYTPILLNPNGGNIGIGTTLATTNEKLSVNGKIRAKEVKVEPTTNWPDYVFEEGYKPLTLAEISTFIKQHKHLPEVPSAKEVSENGLELGEMNKLLLKKVEELTLYLIEKERQLKALEERVSKLEKP